MLQYIFMIPITDHDYVWGVGKDTKNSSVTFKKAKKTVSTVVFLYDVAKINYLNIVRNMRKEYKINQYMKIISL